MASHPPFPWFIRARLKPRQLVLLATLAETANIHRAAERLSMTQPAASKLLKELEDMVQAPLFERLPRGMRPTWYGEAMIRHARAALGSLEQAYDEIQALREGRLGHVAVGAISSPGLTLLPAAVARIKRQHPGIRISLDIETSDVLLERLAQGRLDIAVARLFEEHDKSQLHYHRLSGEPVSAVVRPDHPLLHKPSLALEELMPLGWIVPPAGSVLRHRFELMCREQGLAPPDNIVETGALLFVTRMLAQSDMLAVLATEVAHYYAEHGAVGILPVDMPCQMDDFGIITHTQRPASPAAQLMIRALQQAGQDIYGSGGPPA